MFYVTIILLIHVPFGLKRTLIMRALRFSIYQADHIIRYGFIGFRKVRKIDHGCLWKNVENNTKTASDLLFYSS
jgi:hypothetical protein